MLTSFWLQLRGLEAQQESKAPVVTNHINVRYCRINMLSFPINKFTTYSLHYNLLFFFLHLLKCLSLSKYTASFLLTYLGPYRGRIIRRKRQKNTGARKRGNGFFLNFFCKSFQLLFNWVWIIFFWGGVGWWRKRYPVFSVLMWWTSS